MTKIMNLLGSTIAALGLLFLTGTAAMSQTSGRASSTTNLNDSSGNPLSSTYQLPVAGVGARVTSTPTVQNAAYSSGNCIGGFNAVTMVSKSGASLLLNAVDIKSVAGTTPTVTLYVFDSNPTASTCTDKSTFTLVAADFDKLVMPPQAVTLVAPTGTTVTFATVSNLGRIFGTGANSSDSVHAGMGLWYALVSGSTFTPGSTTDLHITFQAEIMN